MAWYRAGTIKVTANSATVTGTGTAWVQNARVGDGLQGPDGRVYEITNIASNTSLSITPAYQGASATGQTYWIIPVQGYLKKSADRLSSFVDQFGQLPAEISAIDARVVDLDANTLKSSYVQASPNDATAGRLLAVGRSFGLGSVGATMSYDVWPSASLNDLDVPSGNYLLPPSIVDRPPEIGTQNAIVWHRQAGTAGGQFVLYPASRAIWRTRTAGAYSKWAAGLVVGDFGLGGGTVAPRNGRASVNPFGWYYHATEPTWGGGSFFLDMPYSEALNAGLRLSTNPYSDDFFLQGGVSGKKEYRQACKLWHDKNTTVDSNGFIKRASPIIKLAQDGIELTTHLEIERTAFERAGVGHYVLRNVPLLSRDGWYIETPKDRNNNIYFTLDYEEDEQSKTLTIRTYDPDYSTGRATNGEPMDILEGRFVSLRFAEDPGLYPVYVPDPEPVPEPEPDIEPEEDLDLEPLPDPPEPIEEPAA